jgi:membrane protease YdiL (CAAX protease family)
MPCCMSWPAAPQRGWDGQKLDAPITPVRWLGFPKPDPWTSFGGQFALYVSLGTLLFLVIGGRLSPSALLDALPMLPVVLLFATMNAFNEEMTCRASMLAGLEPEIGPQPAHWISAVFFGIGHYFGVPYGIIGVVMASFLD